MPCLSGFELYSRWVPLTFLPTEVRTINGEQMLSKSRLFITLFNLNELRNLFLRLILEII